MQWDRDPAERRVKQRDRLLADYLAHEVAPYSPFYGPALSKLNVSGLADLTRLTPTDWESVTDDPAAFLLRPEEPAIARHGTRRLVLAVTLAKLRRRRDQVNRDVIDPLYKPIHWHLVGDVPVGYSESDLERLGEAGRRMFSLAGLTRYDVLVGVGRAEPTAAYWQVVLGARRAAVTASHLGPEPDPGVLAAAQPSALSGGSGEILAALEAAAQSRVTLSELRTLLVADAALPDDDRRAALRGAAADVGARDVAVVAAWAPRGARALWAECRGGTALHTYPDYEIIEAEGAQGRAATEGRGELLWTSLGWRGTAVLRLRTGEVVELRDRSCPNCHRVGPIVNVLAREEAEGPAGVLDGAPAVTAWLMELRRVNGHEELLVFLSIRDGQRLARVLGELDRQLGATQYVVLPKRDVEQRVSDEGRRVVDLRR